MGLHAAPASCRGLCLAVALCVGGCSSQAFLPSARDTVISPWHSYAEVKEAFDKIVPYQTGLEGLTQLRFTPETSPNIQILNHLDIMQRFLPNQSVAIKDLAPALQECLAEREGCQAYEINLRKLDSDRYGNVVLDILSFRRKTVISGWEFRAIIVMKNGLTVYKLCGGRPHIDENQDRKKPLGPLQSLDGADGLMWNAVQ